MDAGAPGGNPPPNQAALQEQAFLDWLAAHIPPDQRDAFLGQAAGFLPGGAPPAIIPPQPANATKNAPKRNSQILTQKPNPQLSQESASLDTPMNASSKRNTSNSGTASRRVALTTRADNSPVPRKPSASPKSKEAYPSNQPR
ncbi:hypothetical protein NLI96_g12528 [Meripilus lineatus]|uniref:Uncharacterized protein n=1 Tax=Meripilus lineatus TaxID=2056292 RepID=A0AAD5UPX5_9APHY|nr:hypothetical protein NLI96_g12528 [Physisporinus lineatus]